MTRRHSLSDDSDGVAIFTGSVTGEIHDLDATKSRRALTAMINCLESAVPESVIEKTYETCEELQQLRQGGLRLYVKLFTDIPGYTVLWVFAIRKHQYRNLGNFDAAACRKAADLNTLIDKSEVEEYLRRNNALTLTQLENLRAEL